MTQLPTGTVTFLFTDIEGSTALLKELGRDEYEQVLAEQAAILRSAFDDYDGKLIDTQGDSSFVAFRAARDAVAAAVFAQRELAAHVWPDGATLKVRMGLHSGEPKASGERYVGIGVHRASRIGSAAHGGQVLLSETTRSLVEDDLPAGVSLRDLGPHRLKDIDRPERVTQVSAEGLEVDFPPLRGAEPVAAPAPPVLRRRSVLASALVGVVAAAVAIPVFALSQGSGVAQAASLISLDPVKVKETAGIVVPGHPVAVTTCVANVFVSSRNGYVYEIDPRTRKPYPIFVNGRPGDIAHVGGLATVLRGTEATNSVTVIDAGSGTPTARFALPGSPVSSARIAVWALEIYVANPNDHELDLIGSPYTSVARKPISLPPLSSAKLGYSGLAAGPGTVWIAGNHVDRRLWRVNLASGHVTSIRLRFAPRAITYGAGGVWLVDQGDNSVVRVDPKTNKLGRRFRVGQEPTAVTAVPGSRFVWVANALDGSVSRIDSLDGNVTSAKIGGKPIAIAVGLGAVWVLRQTG
jgi:class 3 adenylate cyclase/DNA-binding beta-propeller fold protein YncE